MENAKVCASGGVRPRAAASKSSARGRVRDASREGARRAASADRPTTRGGDGCAEPSSTLRIWRRCARGGRDGDWEKLHSRLSGRIRHWIERGLSGPFRRMPMPEADDLVQDVYCRLLANRGRALRSCRAGCEAELMAYLSRICNSVLVSTARARGALKRQAAFNASWNEIDEDELAAPGLDPEERALVRDVRRKAATCVRGLSSGARRRQRFILDQVLFVGYTSRELSRSIGLSVSAIDTVVSRARHRAAMRGIPFPQRRCRGASADRSPVGRRSACASLSPQGRPRTRSGTEACPTPRP